MKNKVTWVSILFFFIAVIAYSIYRDVQIGKQYPCDLRNRVVGARIIKNGQSPYFYKWKKADGFYYYDPASFDNVKVSNITATPFFLYLLQPLAGLQQGQISTWWLIIEYGALLITLLMALSFCATRIQQLFVIVTTSFFLLTEAWQMQISYGEYYLFIPVLTMLFYFFIKNTNSLAMAFGAGLCAVTLVLIRVNTIFIFIPFLFLIKKYNVKYIATFTLPIILMSLCVLSSKQQRFLWQDYAKHVQEQIKIHQQLNPVLQQNEPDPKFALWEGINRAEQERLNQQQPLNLTSENGNIFVLARFLHLKLSVFMLSVLAFTSIFVVLFLFYKNYKSQALFSLPYIAITGYCLYMISDLFSPIYRHQYYTVQWLFPLLIAATVFQQQQLKLFIVLLIGVILNIVNINFVPMEHTIGEYMLLLGLIILVLSYKSKFILPLANTGL